MQARVLESVASIAHPATEFVLILNASDESFETTLHNWFEAR
jgi:hypothetical protein